MKLRKMTKKTNWFCNILTVWSLCILYAPLASPVPPDRPQILFPSYKYNARNFWLEYSTPPSTVFPDYEDVDSLVNGMGTTSTVVPPGPSFIDRNSSVVSVPVGATASLNCVIENHSKDYQVSWFRRRSGSLVVLTISHETFVADDRFVVVLRENVRRRHDDHSHAATRSNWRLKIRPTVRDDRGEYICQVSTHPPIVLTVQLNVIVPEVRIIDEEDGREISEKHYKPGSTIELHCVVDNFLPQFESVFWMHNDEIVSQDSSRGGISIKTTESNGTVNSHLYLATADANDGGIYSCHVDQMARAKLSLHILNGEEPAAIQSSTDSIDNLKTNFMIFLANLVVFHLHC